MEQVDHGSRSGIMKELHRGSKYVHVFPRASWGPRWMLGSQHVFICLPEAALCFLMQPSLAPAPSLAAKICFYWKLHSEQPRAGYRQCWGTSFQLSERCCDREGEGPVTGGCDCCALLVPPSLFGEQMGCCSTWGLGSKAGIWAASMSSGKTFFRLYNHPFAKGNLALRQENGLWWVTQQPLSSRAEDIGCWTPGPGLHSLPVLPSLARV